MALSSARLAVNISAGPYGGSEVFPTEVHDDVFIVETKLVKHDCNLPWVWALRITLASGGSS